MNGISLVISALHDVFAWLQAALPFPPAFLVIVPVFLIAWQFFSDNGDAGEGCARNGSGSQFDLQWGDGSGGDGGD